MEGHASISPDVLARYAGDAAREVEGVHALVEGHLPGRRPVRINAAEGEQLSVELHLALEWGAAFPDVGRAVQDRVGDCLASVAGSRPARVDVVVAGIGRVRV
jgi:uncharacterized alkaline shock family protein YloU